MLRMLAGLGARALAIAATRSSSLQLASVAAQGESVSGRSARHVGGAGNVTLSCRGLHCIIMVLTLTRGAHVALVTGE